MQGRKPNFIERIASRFGFEKRSVGLKQLEAWQAQFPTMFDGALSSTPAISETSAQKIATVFTCLNVLGETRGSLPFDVKENTSKGSVTVYNHPVHRLIHDRPNPYMTAFDFWSTVEKVKKAWGNCYVRIQRDSNFTPVALWILDSCYVQVINNNGVIYYNNKGDIYQSTEVLHFKNYSTDGICGISSIRQNALTLGLSLKLTQYNSSIIGERPYGYLTSEKKPKDLQQKGQMRSQWDKRDSSSDENDHTDTTKAKTIGGIPYLSGGLEFKSFTLPADDVAYIESAKLTDQDIYGIFRVPPTFAQNWERAPYNSSEQQDIVFAKYSLASIRGDEQECNEKLFPESNKSTGQYYCKVNLRGLLRGDTNTRKEYYTSLIQNGVMSPNMAAEFEDLPTYEGGDQHFIQLNMVPVDKIADVVESQIKKSSGAGQTQSREQIMAELKEKIRPKLNGHFKEIEEFLN